jgi:DNA-binding CsgD family transcriptional regulator
MAQLTIREAEVLAWVADGLTNREIGDALGISAETVKTHLRSTLRKLDCRSRAHAVAAAIRTGLIA